MKMRKQFLFVIFAVLLLIPFSLAAANVDISGLDDDVVVEYRKDLEVTFTVENTGDEDLDIRLEDDRSGTDDDYQTSYSPETFDLGQGDSQRVTLTIENKLSGSDGTKQKSLTVEIVDGGSKLADKQFKVTLEPIEQNLEIETISDVSIREGSFTTIPITLTNTGNVKLSNVKIDVTDTFNGLEVDISPSSISIDEGASNNFNLVLTSKLGEVTTDDKKFVVKAKISGATIGNTEEFTLSVSEIPSSELISVLNENGNTISNFNIDLLREESKQVKWRLRNNGGKQKTVTMGHTVALADSQGRILSLTPNTGTYIIGPGSEQEVVLTISADSSQNLKSYSGPVIFTILGNPDATKSVDLKISLQPALCSDGIVGENKITVKVDKPDDDDEYSIGDTIAIDVNVDSRLEEKEKFKVEAWLYSGNKKITDVEDDQSIKGGNDENFDLELYLDPSEDIDLEDDLVLYIQTSHKGHESEICDQIKVPIDLQTEDEELFVSNINMNPRGEVAPGAIITIDALITNTGEDELENSYMQVTGSRLGINERSNTFFLEEFGNGDRSQTRRSIQVVIPEDAAPGTYSLIVNAVLRSGEVTSSVFTEDFVVLDVGQVTGSTQISDGLSLLNQNAIAKENQEFTYLVTVKNTGLSNSNFEVEFNPSGSWADSSRTFEVLSAGEAKSIVVSVIGTESGQHTGVINVKSDGNFVGSAQVTADIESLDGEKEDGEGNLLTGSTIYTEKATSLFKNTNNVLLVVGIVILVLIVVVLIAVMMRQQNRGYYLPPK